MAERGVLVRRRPDGQYDLMRSRWGGSDRVLAAVAGGRSPLTVDGLTWEPGPRGISFGTFVASLDYPGTEMVYRRDGTTTALLPLWFGLPLSATMASPSAGALVGVRSVPDARGVRTWFRRLKGALADGLVAGSLSIPAVGLALLAALHALEDRPVFLSVGFSPGTGPEHP